MEIKININDYLSEQDKKEIVTNEFRRAIRESLNSDCEVTTMQTDCEVTTMQTQENTTSLLGQYVIIRTYSAGVWAGYLKEKVKNEVYLTEARRLYYWSNVEGISLSGISLNGLNESESKICAPVGIVWLEAIEIIPCTEKAKKSIINQPIYR